MSTQQQSSPTTEFPPLNWLGYGLDLTRVNPFDFASVALSKTQVRIVDINEDTRTRVIPIGNTKYEIPKVVMATPENNSLASIRKFDDGAFAVKALHDESDFAYRLLSVTTSDNSLLCLEKYLPNQNRYYFMLDDQSAYSASLQGYAQFINERELLKHVSKLAPFDSQNLRTVRDYEEFFATVGSHVISSSTFGSRFQLQVWASNTHEDVNENFDLDVTASIRGLNKGGDYSRDVFDQPQYQTFDRLSQRIIRPLGGEESSADTLVNSPDYSTFLAWRDTRKDNSVVTCFGAIDLWVLLRDAENKMLRGIADDLQRAFDYISSFRKGAPNDKRTWVTIEIESDWGEFGILSPSAVIAGGDSDQLTLPCALPKPLSLGPAKLRWSSSSTSAQHLIVLVEVISDSEPIDIYIGCGCGSAKVTILGTDYETKDGIERYMFVPVTRISM